LVRKRDSSACPRNGRAPTCRDALAVPICRSRNARIHNYDLPSRRSAPLDDYTWAEMIEPRGLRYCRRAEHMLGHPPGQNHGEKCTLTPSPACGSAADLWRDVDFDGPCVVVKRAANAQDDRRAERAGPCEPLPVRRNPIRAWTEVLDKPIPTNLRRRAALVWSATKRGSRSS